MLEDGALFELDSVSYKKIFGNHKTEYSNFSNAYLYSIEKPKMGFYPITVIQMFGVAESPMMLVLFDKEGNYINAIEVADAYGEEGGCLNSYFVNDSTLVRQYEWNEYDEDYTNIIATRQKTDTIVIHKNGEISITDK